ASGGRVPAGATPAPAPRAAQTATRSPIALLPGVGADSAEAAEHLVRTRSVQLVVDGYNATLWAWPELPIIEQRRRLVDALGELVARSGACVHVVFDGGDDAYNPPPPSGPRLVNVTFSPAGVEADDVILALVDDIRPDRGVVVVSDDRRVRDGSRRRGANVVSARQLFGVLRRER
ncbi:MAG: NYN domain-containing protein, partial [Acidimicrobiales bacterium]